MSNITIGLFYGSDTGNTENIAHEFKDAWTISKIDMIDSGRMSVADFASYDYIIIGLSTWYDGELQSDFEDFFDEFKTIDFAGKTVAMFGLGDQYGYGEYFVDGLGIIGEVIIANGGQIIGQWPDKGYDYEESKGLIKEGHFYGLALDEDNQMHLTEERLRNWKQQLEQEFSLIWSKLEVAIES